MDDPITNPPEWFRDAINAPCEDRRANVEGCDIQYLRWGDPDKPGILMIPGSGGHVHWLNCFGPLLADQYHVAAMNFGGCGDSGRRTQYRRSLFVEEIIGVCRHAGMMDNPIKPILVAHSFGGQIALRAALEYGDLLTGVAVFDTVRGGPLDTDPASYIPDGDMPLREANPKRYYPDRETAVSRFRLQPEPEFPIRNQYFIDHIGEHSVREEADGWTWKFDPAALTLGAPGMDLKDKLKDITCRCAVVYGEHSHIVGEDTLKMVSEAGEGRIPVFQIPNTSHFLFMNEPFAFLAAAKAIVGTWVSEARTASA